MPRFPSRPSLSRVALTIDEVNLQPDTLERLHDARTLLEAHEPAVDVNGDDLTIGGEADRGASHSEGTVSVAARWCRSAVHAMSSHTLATLCLGNAVVVAQTCTDPLCADRLLE
jgi:hypothetical protein